MLFSIWLIGSLSDSESISMLQQMVLIVFLVHVNFWICRSFMTHYVTGFNAYLKCKTTSSFSCCCWYLLQYKIETQIFNRQNVQGYFHLVFYNLSIDQSIWTAVKWQNTFLTCRLQQIYYIGTKKMQSGSNDRIGM